MSVKLQIPPITDEKVFEDFILDLYNLDYSNDNFQLFGKKGNKQKGIDIISIRSNIAIQCKLKEVKRKNLLAELKKDFKSDIEKVSQLALNIKKLIFVSTFDDNAQLIEYLQDLKQQRNLHFDITYIGWQSLSARIQYHPILLERFFSQYFRTQGNILTPVPFFDINQLLDRNNILHTIEALSKNNRIFSITGIGGAGKTVALSSYVNEKKEKYNSIIWIEHTLEYLKESILSITSFLWKQDNKNQKKTDRWSALCQKLLNTKGNNLLIIDGIERLEDNLFNTIEDIAGTGWQVIITSRVKLVNYSFTELDGLTTKGSIELFKRYFAKSIQDELLVKIVRSLENHPLLIELVAKAANANRKMSLQQLHLILVDNNLKSPELQREINIGKHGRKYKSKRHRNIFKYLLLCFDISNLTKIEKKQLLYFSTFPTSQPINFKSFIEITEQNAKHSTEVENAINKLEEKGWIANRNENYYIHPLIQSVVWEKLNITVDKIKPLVMGCTKQLKEINTIDPWLLNDKIAIAKNILQTTDLVLESLYLSLLYATALTKMGNYETAIVYYKRCEDFAVKNFITEPTFLGGLFNNLGNAYRFTGRFDDAAIYLLMAIDISQINGVENPLSLAHSMDNYASVLETVGRYNESVSITKRAIEIFKAEESKIDLCQAYINIASTYYHLHQFSKAKSYWKKGHDLLNAESDPSLVSSSFNTLGIILQAQNKYRAAKMAFTKGIKVHRNSPNPDILALLYSNLSSVFFQLQQFEKGKILLEKAKDYNKNIGGRSLYNEGRVMELEATYFIYRENYREAENILINALTTYKKIFKPNSDNCVRVEENLRLLRTDKMAKQFETIKATNLFYAIKESIRFFHKLFQNIIDQHGKVKGLYSKTDEAFLHDYIFFCTTKSCKSFSAIITLIDKENAEDALMLLHSVYRNYLIIVYLKNDLEAIDFFIVTPIQVSKGEIKKQIDEEGVIDVLQIINSDGVIIPLYPSLFKLVKTSSYPEDKIVHNYLDSQLSDHVYSNFMTSGNYRDDNSTHYKYKDNSVIIQPILISAYLLILLFQEVVTFINDENLNIKTSKLTSEIFPPLTELIELGNIDNYIKKAMVNRLRKSSKIDSSRRSKNFD